MRNFVLLILTLHIAHLPYRLLSEYLIYPIIFSSVPTPLIMMNCTFKEFEFENTTLLNNCVFISVIPTFPNMDP